MREQPHVVPPASFVEEIDRHFGPAGHRWLAALRDRINEIAAHWSLTVEDSPRHGAHALVLPVTRGDQRFALKLAYPDDLFAAELASLRAWGGHGTVQVFDVLPDDGIMLMEWLDASRDLSSLPIDAAIEEAGSLTRRLALAPPPDVAFPTTTERATTITTSLPTAWEQANRPLSASLLNHAVAAAKAIAHHASRGDMSPMTTWDLHAENVLWGERIGWTLVDPMPLIGSPEVALAPFLWTRTEQIADSDHLMRLVARFVSAAHLDMELTLRWLVVRLVDYWLWGLGVGLTIDPVRCRTILTWLSELGHCPRP